MNSRSVTFYYDYGSPTCYLAWTQLPSICERAGANLIRKPVLLGGIFKAVGNSSPVLIPAKSAWMFADVARFAKRYGVAFNKSSAFPFNSVPSMRGAIWATQAGVLETFDRALFTAAWVDGLDIGNVAIVQEVAAKAGLDATVFSNAIQTPDIKEGLVKATREAVASGVFGAPTFMVDGVLHFGQDRLPWVQAALSP